MFRVAPTSYFASTAEQEQDTFYCHETPRGQKTQRRRNDLAMQCQTEVLKISTLMQLKWLFTSSSTFPVLPSVPRTIQQANKISMDSASNRPVTGEFLVIHACHT